MIPPSLCVRCKGRLWCGPRCFVMEQHALQQNAVKTISGKQFTGSSPPGLLVSWKGYPNIKVSALSTPSIEQNAKHWDNPEQWIGVPKEKIVEFRSSLIAGQKPFKVSDARNPNYSLIALQEISLSEKSFDLDMTLSKAPTAKLSFSSTLAPVGPSAPLEKMDFSSNPRIPKQVEKFYSDTDAKAGLALNSLYEKGFSVNYLQKMLSSGSFGVKKQRKLVPTRWSITATDDTVCKNILKIVKRNPAIAQWELFESTHFSNHFVVLLAPTIWQFELLESWMPGSYWNAGMQAEVASDFEFFSGMKGYADNTAGAYFAARLAVAEHLQKRKRQSGALVFREISPEYMQPLGVWIIRQSVREALKQKPQPFNTLSEALSEIGKRLKLPLESFRKTSKVLDAMQKQKRLAEWA